MGIFNPLGLIYVVLLLIPNIIYLIRHKENEKKNEGKIMTILENVGRYGSMIFMIVNVPYTYFNFFFASAGVVYVVVDAFFVILYYAAWIFIPKDKKMLYAISLSVLPSLLFLVSGILLLNIPLLVFGVVFALCHIYISVKNAK